MLDLRPELLYKRILDFTDDELLEAGFAGDGVPDCIKQSIAVIKEDPDLMGSITAYPVFCELKAYLRRLEEDPKAPLSPPSSKSSNLVPQVRVTDDALTIDDGEYITTFEQSNYYIGICANNEDVPRLYYRTNYRSAPFLLPSPGEEWFTVKDKTMHGVFDKVLTDELWSDVVCPAIMKQVLKARGINWQAVHLARFSSDDDNGVGKLGPIVILIQTHRGKTRSEDAHLASPDILRILAEHGVQGVEVEWCESKS